MQYFSACPRGIEGLLLAELQDLGYAGLRETVAGVYFESDRAGAYRACLWSRLANRVLRPLARFDVNSADDLYQGARQIEWDELLLPDATLLVNFSGSSDVIRNTQFGAVTVKDAVVDCLRERRGRRPSVSREDPDLRIHARLSKGGQVTLSLDLCGDSLHRRGYRTEQGTASLKENLAAALLLRSSWPEIVARGGTLIDPMCGSGTLLVEAAFMALDRAPGLERRQYAFERWPDFERQSWQDIREEALQRHREARGRAVPEIRGYDADRKVLFAAESNIARAGLEQWVRVLHKPLAELVRPTHTDLVQGLVIVNPPYGERLGEQESLRGVYRLLGDTCRREFPHWMLSVFTGNPELGKSLGLRAHKRYKLYNGALPCELLLIDIEPSSFVDAPPAGLPRKASPGSSRPLDEGAEMLVNRLRKNMRQLSKWLRREDISCFRLYDADMPEYAAAIDVYQSGAERYVHVQEYAAPKSVDENRAQQRFESICAAVPVALEVPADRISFKQRRRNRGRDQYQRQSSSTHTLLPVREGSATLLVNLWEYLDTGLFLDHRPVRKMIAEMAPGKRFLSLFCYTATATVQAALAGAPETISVDMSRTYLEWAERNLQANRVGAPRHQLVQADCRQWLQDCRQGFDLILLDPPSFSNSKRMQGVLDIQRDHAGLIRRCMDLLLPGGTLIFSTNLRSFSMDTKALQKYNLEDISARTLDPDFQRNRRIHQCWLIRQTAGDV